MVGVGIHTDCVPCPPQKSKSLQKPVKRWSCENELHKRLSNLKKELDKFKDKLAKITRRARAKLRREFEDYVEEVPKVGDRIMKPHLCFLFSLYPVHLSLLSGFGI